MLYSAPIGQLSGLSELHFFVVIYVVAGRQATEQLAVDSSTPQFSLYDSILALTGS
jgi:hypothetical protein